MITKPQLTFIRIMSSLWLALAALLLACHDSRGQTFVSGNISGTWSPAGNPYIAADNCTVPLGQTLTIQPGVVVWIGEGLSITVNGSIQAVGTPTQRITFQPPIASQYWSNIYCLHSAGTNRFKYCDFRNADTALELQIIGGSDVMNVEIMNCNFTNCLSRAVFGQANGIAGTFYNQYAVINAVIKNCYFTTVGDGCKFHIDGMNAGFWGIGYGYSGLETKGNVFCNVTNVAIALDVGPYAGQGQANVINNTLVNCRVGISATDPWDALVQNNIIVGSTNAVKVHGSLTRTVNYNDLYANATNFSGLPVAYGQMILVNRNGTPSDILYNIFRDPQFMATNDFHLISNSPCVDAGTADWASTDMCFPPSLGSILPDQGAYGGPDAANWLDIVPKLPVQAFITKSDNVIQIGWGAIPRSVYQIQYITNFTSAGTNNWLNLPNGKVLAVDKPTSITISTNANALGKQFFRIQSLGRTLGN